MGPGRCTGGQSSGCVYATATAVSAPGLRVVTASLHVSIVPVLGGMLGLRPIRGLCLDPTGLPGNRTWGRQSWEIASTQGCLPSFPAPGNFRDGRRKLFVWVELCNPRRGRWRVWRCHLAEGTPGMELIRIGVLSTCFFHAPLSSGEESRATFALQISAVCSRRNAHPRHQQVLRLLGPAGTP